MKKARSPFHIMVKPRGPICNLACEYCYYLPKKKLYPDSDFRMTSELLANFTQQMIAAQPGSQVTFSWQGGEPTLMGLDFFEEAIQLQKKFAPRSMRVTNTMQTNGTILNPAWCRFFKANNFLIGLSLDGPSSIHNTYRYNKIGQGTFDYVMRAARLLKQHNVDFNILCCVHQANINHPLEVYQFLRDKVGARFIQFIPIIQRELDEESQETQSITKLSIEGAAYGEFLKIIFDEWVRHDVGRVFVQLFDVALGVYVSRPSSLCVFTETCGWALVLEHNGDLYSCDHFVNPENRLGNITQTPLVNIIDSEKQNQFGMNKQDKLSQTCLDCDVRFICNGGCPKNRDESGLNLLCEGYRSFFRYINQPMRMMADLLWQKRAPAEIMQLIKLKNNK